MFKAQFKAGIKYPANLFYEWHTKLTGSCTMGKDSFIENNGVDMSKQYTVTEFVELVKHQYGSDVIKQLP